jgi:hypothetical protein
MDSRLNSLISSAIRSIIHPPSNRDEIILFLSSRDPDKPNDVRLISWLVAFNVIPSTPSKWSHSLSTLYTEYLNIRSSLSTSNESFDFDLGPIDRIIKSDTSRSIVWFTEMSQNPIFSDLSSLDGEFTANCILAVLHRQSFSYIQGYDRYVFVTLLLAFDFCVKADLPSDFAEAISFNLSREFIKLTEISTFLENAAETQSHFERLDEELLIFAPAWLTLLRRSHQGSIHFALRWELLLFADEYPVKSLLLLWDHTLKWKTEFHRFRTALSIAHVKQTPLPTQNEMPIEVIQNYRGWDVSQVIDEAVWIMRWNPKLGYRNWLIAFIVILVVMMLVKIRY